MMTKEEAFKELGIRYVGPNVKAKFFKLLEDYAKERCEEMRSDCAFEARKHDDILEDLANDINSLPLPEFD